MLSEAVVLSETHGGEFGRSWGIIEEVNKPPTTGSTHTSRVGYGADKTRWAVQAGAALVVRNARAIHGASGIAKLLTRGAGLHKTQAATMGVRGCCHFMACKHCMVFH